MPGLAWPLADDVTDEALETRLFGRAGVTQLSVSPGSFFDGAIRT